MIRIGALITRGDMPKKDSDFNVSANSLLLHMAASYGIELFLFSPEDVDLEKNTVNGLFLEYGKPKRRKIPIPYIVDNKTIALGSDEWMVKFFSDLKERTRFTRNMVYFAKMGQYNRITKFYKNKGFADIVIPTLEVGKETDVMLLVDTLGDDIILKPDNSSRGRGIFGIRKNKRGFSVIKDDADAVQMSLQEFRSYLSEQTKSIGYIAQKRIYSVTSSGCPFDVRILVQRKNKDSFDYVMYPRIGGGKILSNIAAGGSTMPLDSFLAENYYENAPEVKAMLETFAQTFPPYYQKFLKDPFFDLGFDIGIEKVNDSFRLWLFEVNQGPQFAFRNNLAELHMKITRATLECYRYLYSELDGGN